MNKYTIDSNEIEAMVNAYKAELIEHHTMFDVALPTCKAVNKPVVKFTDRAWEYCQQLVAQCDKEIAWNATVLHPSSMEFIIDDIIIFPQIVTGASVDVDPTEYAQWVAGIPEDTLNNLRCHCHSHVNMGTFSSNVDDDYQKQLVQGNVRDYYVFLIFNKKGSIFARIYDVEHNLFYDNTDIEIERPDNATPIASQVSELIKNNVRTVIPTTKHTGKTGGIKGQSSVWLDDGGWL